MQVEVRVENVALVTAGRGLPKVGQDASADEVGRARFAHALLGLFGCTDHRAAKSDPAWGYPDGQSIGTVLPDSFDGLASSSGCGDNCKCSQEAADDFGSELHEVAH